MMMVELVDGSEVWKEMNNGPAPLLPTNSSNNASYF